MPSTRIHVGDSVDGSIAHDGEVDRYRIHLDAGESYSFDVSGDNGFDTTLTLRGHGENVFDDDGGGFPDPHIDFTPDQSGWYTLEVRGYDYGSNDTGYYTLDTDYQDDWAV